MWRGVGWVGRDPGCGGDSEVTGAVGACDPGRAGRAGRPRSPAAPHGHGRRAVRGDPEWAGRDFVQVGWSARDRSGRGPAGGIRSRAAEPAPRSRPGAGLGRMRRAARGVCHGRCAAPRAPPPSEPRARFLAAKKPLRRQVDLSGSLAREAPFPYRACGTPAPPTCGRPSGFREHAAARGSPGRAQRALPLARGRSPLRAAGASGKGAWSYHERRVYLVGIWGALRPAVGLTSALTFVEFCSGKVRVISSYVLML